MFGEMWFFDHWSSGRYTHDLRRASQVKELRVFSSRSITAMKKSNSLTCTVASPLVCTSSLAVITVVGFLDILMVSNSAELRFADHMHTSSGIYHKLSFLQLFCWCSWQYPFFRGRIECSFVVFFELVNVFGKIPCLASGASLLSFSLFIGPVLKFHSVGTSLIRNFDLYFLSNGPFISPDTCLTQRRLCDSYSSNWSQNFLHRVSPRLFWNSCHSESCETQNQVRCSFRNNDSILVVAFSSFVGMVPLFGLFIWLLINLVARE